MTDAPDKIRTNAAGNAVVTPYHVWDTDLEYIRADVADAAVAAAYIKGWNEGITAGRDLVVLADTDAIPPAIHESGPNVMMDYHENHNPVR